MKPVSNGVVRSTSPVTSTEPSRRNDGCRSSMISKPAPSSAARLVAGNSAGSKPGIARAPTTPEGGVDEHGEVPSSELLRDSLHSGDVVPVTVAEHDRLDVSGRELEPVHVLDDTGRGDACVEEDRPLAAAGRHANERREARLGNQRVGQPVVGEGRGDARLRELVKPGHSLDLVRREEQRVGQVVHQDRDPDGVDRCERDRDHGEGQGCQTSSTPGRRATLLDAVGPA